MNSSCTNKTTPYEPYVASVSDFKISINELESELKSASEYEFTLNEADMEMDYLFEFMTQTALLDQYKEIRDRYEHAGNAREYFILRDLKALGKKFDKSKVTKLARQNGRNGYYTRSITMDKFFSI